ncbi:hypothetical protein HF086_008092 [Spodoptera exigua]|uniref:Stress-induced-phosphoprotein 1 n=1 Tax=Spodoptera exigua TaxID=7107 RepID=A0A922MPK3_SPOEX|nr:hypothetical protein HF086_008092 [Spodoptera exigua]
MDQATQLKNKGNAALEAGKLDDAVRFYTEAIAVDPTNHVLYSNRSAAHAKASNFEEALVDAERTIALNPTWSKGYSRKASTLAYLGRWAEAIETYNKGLELDPNNEQLATGLLETKNKFELICQKLRNDPRSREWLNDPEYYKIIAELTREPLVLNKIFNRDLTEKDSDRLHTTFEILYDIYKEPPQKQEPQRQEPPKKQEPEKPKYDDLPENRRLALQEKDQGNEFYKKKDFDNALMHYQNAVKHDPTDITFYTNMAAVYFEQKEYEKCIKECEKAIDIGRENRADFKLIAKAFTRIGNAYKKMEQWKLAKTYYEKSMSEHRTPEIKTLLTIKRNPDDPKLYSNRAACYTKLAAFDLGLKDCDHCCKLDPKFIKGWIRKGKILQVRKRAMADPEVQQILRDPAMRCILEQMQQDPHALQDHLKNPDIAAKIQKLLESGLIAIH